MKSMRVNKKSHKSTGSFDLEKREFMERLCKSLRKDIFIQGRRANLFETQFPTKNGERASYSAEYFEGCFEGWLRDKGGEN